MVETTKLPNRYPDFAARVQAAMTRRGMEVQGIVDFFKKTGETITYEMVRRYTLGQAMPRHRKMEILAAALGLPPSALQFGEGAGSGSGSATAHQETETQQSRSGWPFPNLDPERYEALSETQKASIEEWVIEQVDRFRAVPRPGKRVAARKSRAA